MRCTILQDEAIYTRSDPLIIGEGLFSNTAKGQFSEIKIQEAEMQNNFVQNDRPSK